MNVYFNLFQIKESNSWKEVEIGLSVTLRWKFNFELMRLFFQISILQLLF